MAKVMGLAADAPVLGDLDHLCAVVSSSLSCSLVGMSSFWVWHLITPRLLLLAMQRVLAQTRVVLHELQSLGRVALVLGRRVVILSVFGTHDSNDFSGFGFLGHIGLSGPAGMPSRLKMP